MKKMGIRTLSLLLMVSMMFCVMPTALAKEAPQPMTSQNQATPYFEIISSTSCTLSSNGSVYVSARGTSSVKSIVINATLQKKGLFGWSDVTSFSKTINAASGTMSESASLSSGSTYRVFASYKFTAGSTSESTSQYSSEIKA